MLKEMRRKDRQISEEEARLLLEKGEYGVLATIGTEYPYAIPVNYAVIKNYIYIHGTNEGGQKIDNININNKVCFTVVGDTEVLADKFSERYESIIALGTIEEVFGDEKQLGAEELINKYSSEFKDAGMKYIKLAIDKISVHRITIEQITGKARR